MQFLTRAAKPSDLNLVRSSWLRSYRREMPDMEAADYYRDQHARTERLLQTSRVLIAHIEGAPDVIIGWMCSSPTAVHYAWVQRGWQRQGALTMLLADGGFGPWAFGDAGPIACTHLTRDWRRAVPRFRYLPYFDAP